MSLQTDLDALMQAVVTKAAALVSSASPTDLALLSKATEMVRGSISLAAILQTSTTAQGLLTAAQVAALAALDAALDSAEGAVGTAQTSAIAALTTQYNTFLTNISTAINAIGLRVGEIEYRILPDPASPPDSMWICDGSVKATSDCPTLVTAWGLGVGGIICPFVTRYNATKLTGSDIAVSAGSITLPDLRNLFMRPVQAADMGKCVTDQIKSHTHSTAAVSNTGSNGVDLTAPGAFKLTASGAIASTANAGSPGETFPKYVGAVALLRYK